VFEGSVEGLDQDWMLLSWARTRTSEGGWSMWNRTMESDGRKPTTDNLPDDINTGWDRTTSAKI
jgi:hypothetical protein